MVTRSFSFQEISYSRLLQVPDEREFLNLEELKPHQLTELGININELDGDPGNGLSNNNQLLNEPSLNTLQQHHQQNISSSPQSNNSCKNSPVIVTDYTNRNEYTYYNLNSHHGINSSYSDDINVKSCQSFDDRLKLTSPHIDETGHESPKMQPPGSSPICSSRKRKNLYTDTSDFDDDTSDDSRSTKTNDDNKKQNHSEIEKRRRDKMNTYITELSSMVPMCSKSKKLDKLTVLRRAVQHLKSIRGAVHSYTEGQYKPAFLSDSELKMLILQAAEGFLFVVDCIGGRILYVSKSVSDVLHYSQSDLLGQNWFNILHPKDVSKVKEQLSSSDSPRETLIDSRTMLPVNPTESQGLNHLCPGARRSFFCRMKYKSILTTEVKEEINEMSGGSEYNQSNLDQTTALSSGGIDKKYCVIQCTGYLKSWASTKANIEEEDAIDDDGDSSNMACLVAIGRQPPNLFASMKLSPNFLNLKPIQFNSRHGLDGKFIFIDQRATLVLGFLPQELHGTSMYEYYQQDDVTTMAEVHKSALRLCEKIVTPVYGFRTKDNGIIRLQSEWKAFKNPWTKDVEYMVAKNTVILNGMKEDESTYQVAQMEIQIPENTNFFNQSNNRDIPDLINRQVEANEIGRKVAQQVFQNLHRNIEHSSSENSPDPIDVQLMKRRTPTAQILSSGENSGSGLENANKRYISSPNLRMGSLASGYNSSFRGSLMNSPDPGSDSEIIRMMSNSAMPGAEHSPIPTVNSGDGNDEAAMAVIMSYLEADVGLNVPSEFSGLPWPLP